MDEKDPKQDEKQTENKPEKEDKSSDIKEKSEKAYKENQENKQNVTQTSERLIQLPRQPLDDNRVFSWPILISLFLALPLFYALPMKVMRPNYLFRPNRWFIYLGLGSICLMFFFLGSHSLKIISRKTKYGQDIGFMMYLLPWLDPFIMLCELIIVVSYFAIVLGNIYLVWVGACGMSLCGWLHAATRASINYHDEN